MPLLNLTSDELLSTTRSVRKGLDLTRPVERHLIEECLALAVQAPNAVDQQLWRFLVVTDPTKRAALAELYRRGMGQAHPPALVEGLIASLPEGGPRERMVRVVGSAVYLAQHLQDVPVLVIPCMLGRTDGQPTMPQSWAWGTIMPATWSFMLAARARGLGTTLTSYHLAFEREAAEVLGIPYDDVMQTGMVVLAHATRTTFRPAARHQLDTVVRWESWS